MNLILIAIGCGLIAVLYGLFTSRQVLNAPAGNQRMIEVAGAIQEGASAYLRRQYTTIGVDLSGTMRGASSATWSCGKCSAPGRCFCAK